tara:strand:+ start:1441 stop:1593 length:153 start_codon:yes stop_codon:yes gene_type:complete
MDTVFTKPLQNRWTEIAFYLGLAAEQLPQANEATTHGDWIRGDFEIRKRK